MSNKIEKTLQKAIAPLLTRYDAVNVDLDMTSAHPKALVVFTDGKSVLVNRIPSTSGTEIKHVAMNILKAARMALRMGEATAGYGGGKA